MIHYLKGKIVAVHPTGLILETGGMGYFLKISLYTYEAVKNNTEAQLFTSLVVRNENQSVSGFDLYGFFTEAERELFDTMTSVSGVGAATTRMMLSTFSPEEVRLAILHENEAMIQRVKGIGPKMAKRIILELKDKMARLQTAAASPHSPSFPQLSTGSQVREEAVSALLALGFPKPAIEKAMLKLAAQQAERTVEDWIKEALKLL
jgi:Holliday junction DNA helicase RuvA